MIRINQIKVPIFEIGQDADAELEVLKDKASKLLKCRKENIRKLKIARRSIDAREQDRILFIYSVLVKLHDSITGPSAETEASYISRLKNKNISQENKPVFKAPMLDISDEKRNKIRPVIIGSGPCGLFAAIIMAESGLKPIIIERGLSVDERSKKIELFFETGKLDKNCNIQFGEGGAGTFSDGKLNTGVKDPYGYIGYVLNTFAKFGADPKITYDQKPHIGTDVLIDVVKNIREYVISRGGEYIFNACFDNIISDEGKLTAIEYTELKTGNKRKIETSYAVLAIGHSARDTYKLLFDLGLCMEQKSFAVGLRIQHPQRLIDKAMYGSGKLDKKTEILGAASYKLTHRASNGRNIYSFCMCPGGYVVNSSSEEKGLCVNGMSYSKRDSGTANSALIVGIDPEDFGSDSPLAGIEFQRMLEKRAYGLLGGVIPYETYKEFKAHEKNVSGASNTELRFKGYSGSADVRSILPKYVGDAIEEGIEAFDKKISGFASDDAVLAGIESRTSSPLRILRGNDGASVSIKGLYPAGEGAGYAGGITSAAADGIKTALKIIEDIKLKDLC